MTNELINELHCLNGLLLLVLPVVAAIWLLVQWRRQRQPGAAGRVMVFLVQAALIFQVFLGVIQVQNRERRPLLHYELALLALLLLVGAAWIEPRQPGRRSLFLALALLAAGVLLVVTFFLPAS